MNPLSFVRLAALAATLVSAPLWASGLESLEVFLKQVRTGRAEFVQTVTAPAREGQVAKVKTSSGLFEFARPGHFRFVYRKPFEQTIVADGQTLWFHDVDLNQVTARKQSQVLSSTPAALIAAAPDLKALQADFSFSEGVAEATDVAGLQWVKVGPRQKDSALQQVRLGFRSGAQGPELATLDILDSFGQRSLLQFAKLEINLPLNAASFQFKPPAGVDVVRQ